MPCRIFRDGDRKGRVRVSPDISLLAACPQTQGQRVMLMGFGAGRIRPPAELRRLWLVLQKKSWEVFGDFGFQEPCANRGEGPPQIPVPGWGWRGVS